MGEAALVPAASRVCLGQRLMLIRLFPQTVSEKFLLYVIRSPSFQSRVQASAIGMTVKHINVGKVEDLAVPVPPLSVQRRIVALVDALFERCDDLFEQLASKLAVAEQMAAFTAATITGITMDYPEDKSMAIPKTELVAQLRVGDPPKGRILAPLATILIRHDGELPAKDLWQRFGGEIDAFYAQLKKEVANGWIAVPSMAAMREVPREKENA